MTVRLANASDDLTALMEMINVAYKTGEAGIMVDTSEQPFQRMLLCEIQELVDGGCLLVLDLGAPPLVGCIKVKKHVEDTADGKRVGEWGCLTVSPEHQGKGYGGMLQRAAEMFLKGSGCVVAQLELLTPAHWTHTHKERLRQWYVERLGYTLKVAGDYEGSTTRLSAGTKLLDRFLLAVDSDFTIYRRTIP